jgi:hypothetical protein
MERAEKFTRSAHSRTAAEPSASNAAPIADHRPAAAAQRALAGWVAQREPIQRAPPEEDLQMKADPIQRAAGEEQGSEEEQMMHEIFNDPNLSPEERRVFGALYDSGADPAVRMQAQTRVEAFRRISWPQIKAEREATRLKKEEAE